MRVDAETVFPNLGPRDLLSNEVVRALLALFEKIAATLSRVAAEEPVVKPLAAEARVLHGELMILLNPSSKITAAHDRNLAARINEFFERDYQHVVRT